ncbi:MAG: hypothetical protein AAFW01_11845, partial [Pseudomonadota bacterium]
MTAPQPFESAALQSPARTARLWTEFLALFLGVPVLMLFTAGQFPLFPVLAMLLALEADRYAGAYAAASPIYRALPGHDLEGSQNLRD